MAGRIEVHCKPHGRSRKSSYLHADWDALLAASFRIEISFRFRHSNKESKFFWHWCWSYIKNRPLSRIKFYYQLWEMDSSKIEIGKLIRASNNWSTQLNGREYISSKEKYIRSNIIINGLVERTYNHCCIWREVVTKGASTKWCRNKHISIHYWKGDLVVPLIIDQVVEKFNLLHPRS